MRDWFERFMMGRYGVDQLSKVLNWISLILLIISMFLKKDILVWIAIAVMVYSYFRILSRNIGKRYTENEKFLDFIGRFRRGGGRYGGNYQNGTYNDAYQKHRYQKEQKKIYKFFYCPQCKQKVRVPKGKGKICITCPKCRMEFVRRS